MTEAAHESEENLYSILQCNESATYQELKQNYQQLIREYHPDKQNGERKLDHDKFLKIDGAWKILRDQELRKQYDATVLQDTFDEHVLVHAELEKSQLVFKGKDTTMYPCRCGSNFVIHQKYLIEDECIVECTECSNCIVIR